MKYLLIGSFLAFSFSKSFAQKFSTSISAQLAIPQEEFKETNDALGFGVRANFLYKPWKDIPMKFGLELGMQEKENKVQHFSGSWNGYYDRFKVSASNNIFSIMLLTRFETPKLGRIKPFIGLSAGWNVFFSTVNVERLTFYGPYNSSYSNSTKAHWALAYGAAGGVDIPLNKEEDIGLELKIAYLIGNNSRYLTNPYIDADANVSFMEKNSRTNMLIPQAGIRINID